MASSEDPPPPATTTNKENAASSAQRKRRSARVLQHDPIIAPGFGTRKDLEKLAAELSKGSETKLPVEAVEALMRSRGRGLPGNQTPAAPAPINAWADFMKEEGVEEKQQEKDTASEETPARRSMAAAAPASTAGAATTRVYELPLQQQERPTKKAKKSTPGGILVQAGTLDSAVVGRTKLKDVAAYHLLTPTRIFNSVPIARVFTSCNAAHSIAIATDGTAYGWGRNEAGQLSHDLPDDIVLPEKLENLATTVQSAACGKSHTIFHLTDGTLWAAGANKVGQWVCVHLQICKTTASAYYPMIWTTLFKFLAAKTFPSLSRPKGSSTQLDLPNLDSWETERRANTLSRPTKWLLIIATSLPNAPHSATPRPRLHANNDKSKVVPLPDADIRIAQIACGKHHTIAVEAPSNQKARVFSWGCGNYGTLGHGVQADEYYPRLIGIFAKLPLPDGPFQVAAGATCSLLRASNGHVYYWGKHRSVGEAAMRPSLVDVLANNGHNVTQFAAGGKPLSVRRLMVKLSRGDKDRTESWVWKKPNRARNQPLSPS